MKYTGGTIPPKEFEQWSLEPQFAAWWDLIHGIVTPSADSNPAPSGIFDDKTTIVKVNAALSLLKKGAWNGKGPSFDDVAKAVRDVLEGNDKDSAFAQWTPDSPTLPFPLDYPLEKQVKAVSVQTAKLRKEDESKLNPGQLALQDARSTMKSGILLAMKAAEFAGKGIEDVELVKAEVQKIAVMLWGKTINLTPPADLDETKVLDWYKEQVKALTSNVTADPVAVPGEGPGAGQVVVPLVAQYNQLVELYDTVNKEMVSKGNTEAGQQFLLVIQAKSEDLRDQIQILTADVFGMLATLVEIIKGEGGVFEFSAIGMQYIDQAVSAAVVLIGETEVQLQPTAEESQAAQDAADKLADLIKKAKEALGWAYGMIEGLKAYADSIDLEFSDGTQDRIAELKVKIEDEFPKEKESNWWLLLLAAAAAAASQRK